MHIPIYLYVGALILLRKLLLITVVHPAIETVLLPRRILELMLFVWSNLSIAETFWWFWPVILRGT